MISFFIENTAKSAVQRRSSRLLNSRRQFVERLLRDTLARVIPLTPVDTGRSRAAWVNALEQLGGSPPPGWQGETPTDVDTGRNRGHIERHDAQDVSDILAVNEVDYVHFLEYGTSQQSPHAMARRALSQTHQQLAGQTLSLFD